MDVIMKFKIFNKNAYDNNCMGTDIYFQDIWH